jgi:hypothetical protein
MDVSDGLLRLTIRTGKALATRRRFGATLLLRPARAFALCSEVFR